MGAAKEKERRAKDVDGLGTLRRCAEEDLRERVGMYKWIREERYEGARACRDLYVRVPSLKSISGSRSGASGPTSTAPNRPPNLPQ